MDGHLDCLPQIFHVVAAMAVVVIPPLLKLSQELHIVEQSRLNAAVKAGVVLVQIANLVF